MGRKRKDGKRTKSGQLSRALNSLRERNAPSQKVVDRQDRFRLFMGESSIGHEMTCAGRLMLVGAFDGMEQAPEVILSGLLAYQHAYWGNYGGGAAVAQYERSDRSYDAEWADPAGAWFTAIDKLLTDCGYAVRKAVIDVTVDRHWFPDEDVSWAARIINSRVVDKRRQLIKAGKEVPSAMGAAGELATDSDWSMLQLLRIGASALCGERNRKAA